MHGASLGNYAYGMWAVVILNILLFLVFALAFIKPKRKIEWRTMGIFAAFLAALFTEMYGFPLTIYFLTALLGKSYPVLNPFSHPHGHLVLVFLGLSNSATAMMVLHLISNGTIVFGFYLLYKGWKLVYKSKGQRLVTENIYSVVRHPQYDGLFLITIGFLIQWPSLSVIIMWPVLMVAYYRLAMREERELENEFNDDFKMYRKSVPAFIPRLRKDAVS